MKSGANMDEMMQGFIEVPRTGVSIEKKKFAGKFTSRAVVPKTDKTDKIFDQSTSWFMDVKVMALQLEKEGLEINDV